MSISRLLLPALAAVLLTGCIPPPADIGVDYSGPIYRKPGADDPRVVTNAPVLPANAGDECRAVNDVPTRKRSDCGVRQVMERYNPGLQTLYQKRLADEPMMKGNIVLRLIINADGNPQAVDIASSDIHDPEFIRQVVTYVRGLHFGALDAVPAWSDTYTVQFTPPSDVIPEKNAKPALAATATPAAKPARTLEDVRTVIDGNNTAMQLIYQRGLRTRPDMQGTVVVHLAIAPNGSVTSAEIASSELKNKDVEKQLADRIKALNFGPVTAEAVWDTQYSLNFAPTP